MLQPTQRISGQTSVLKNAQVASDVPFLKMQKQQAKQQTRRLTGQKQQKPSLDLMAEQDIKKPKYGNAVNIQA